MGCRVIAVSLTSCICTAYGTFVPELIPILNAGPEDDALEYFMNEGRIDRGRFDLILDFVRALGHSPNFDSLFWIKRILAEGHEQAKARALRMLACALEQSSGWLGEAGQNVLSAISVWLPEDAKTIDNVNNQAAVLLTPRLSFHMAASRLRQRDVGKVDRLVPFFDNRILQTDSFHLLIKPLKY